MDGWMSWLHSHLFLPALLGKPESYADYFSLNRTTAELVLLKPVDRELHSRFDLVIKVREPQARWGRGGVGSVFNLF